MQLKRQFGLWTAVTMLVGQVIAVGIFLVPAGMAKSVDSPFWLFTIWIVMGAMTLSGALCYGELAARFPSAGGSYVYLREVWGRAVAFLYGWMDLLVLDPGLTALLAVGLTGYFVFLVPLSDFNQKLFAMAVVIILGLLNILGARLSANVLKVLTFLKIGTLLFIIGFGFFGGFGDWNNFTPFFAVPKDKFDAFAGGIMNAFFAFAGWWEITRMAGEVENPQKNLPKALAIGVAAITLIYILTSAVFLYLVPLAGITTDKAFAAQAGEVLFGKTGGIVFSAIVIVSVLATLVAYLMISPRVYYAMAKDGLFFKSFGELHPRFETPHRATIIQIILACILILSGTFEQILSYFFFVVVFFIALTVAGLFRIHKKEFSGYKTFLYPLTPIFFLLVTAVVLMMIAMKNPKESFLGVAVVLLGLPVYHFVLRRNSAQL
jgi:APA family basic amino acid/polyamine antiporter